MIYRTSPIPSRIPRSAAIADYAGYQHWRWGQGAHLQIPQVSLTSHNLSSRNHPDYDRCIADWEKWRIIMEGGDTFVDEYLKKFSRRESSSDFRRRKEITPSGGFAMAAIDEIKNSIFQRMTDTVRVGGSETYQQAIRGQQQGVDLRGGTMNWFIGNQVLPELLSMRRIGVYVDNKQQGPTIRDKGSTHPYFYRYRTEDFINWDEGERDPLTGALEYTNIMLRDYSYIRDPVTRLPIGTLERYRHVFLGDDGFVKVQYYDLQMNPMEFIELNITRIPFVCFEISKSLLQDVANYQIALMNLDSSDISYILTGNIPFYTEQFDSKGNSALLKQAVAEYRANCPPGSPGASDCPPEVATVSAEVDIGGTQGRRYPSGLERPGFISPSTEPLKASMAKQEAMKQDIRALVHLSLSNIQAKMASAESKSMDNAGLESGLSYIGLELEHGERQLATYWEMYENSGKVATVNYPQKWSLRSPEEVQKEVTSLTKIREDIPSLTFKKEVNRKIAEMVIGTSVTNDTLTQITKELRNAPGSTSDPDIVEQDVKNGYLSPETAIKLRSYPDDELAKAEDAHARRLARIQEAQAPNPNSGITNPGARGIPELSANPAQEIEGERAGTQTRGAAQ